MNFLNIESYSDIKLFSILPLIPHDFGLPPRVTYQERLYSDQICYRTSIADWKNVDSRITMQAATMKSSGK